MIISKTTHAMFICTCGKHVFFGDTAYLYLSKFPTKEDDGFVKLVCEECHDKEPTPNQSV